MTVRSDALCLARACAVAGASALAACSGDFNPVRDAAVYTGVGPDRKAAPEFVTQSRPADLRYQPIGRIPPARAMPAKPAPAVQASEAEMNTRRAANEVRAAAAREAGATPAPQAPPVAR